MNQTWKTVEARIAALFGGVRNWLSGANGGGDVAILVNPENSQEGRIPHPTLWISQKHYTSRLNFSVWELLEQATREAKKENKKPILVLHKKYSRKALVATWMDTFD